MRASLGFTLLLLGTAAAGCGAKVGGSCTTNVECSPMGDRICDTAQLDGYCTIEGCDLTTCPSEAGCVRFFSSNFLAVKCNPATEDAIDPAVTPTHDCTSSEICLSNGFCAQRTSERRFCMKTCDGNGDCRSGYECVWTGTQGAEAVPDPGKPGRQLHFCAQKL